MNPPASERNFTPTSTALLSELEAVTGRALSLQRLHGQARGCDVVNVHVWSAASALPAVSVAPALTVAV